MNITKKEDSFLFQLAGQFDFKIPAIVKYEIYRGDKKKDPFWSSVFGNPEILPSDDRCAEIAAEIYLELKQKNQLIPTYDILIAATASGERRRDEQAQGWEPSFARRTARPRAQRCGGSSLS